MDKFRRAVFCYYILGFDRELHAWLISIGYSLRLDGLTSIDDAARQQVAKWLIDMFSKNMDFATVIQTLAGDAFYERNLDDVQKLQSEVGRAVTELWDTHAIFQKYPHLRGLARNKEFEEKIWPAIKSAAKQKQK